MFDYLTLKQKQKNIIKELKKKLVDNKNEEHKKILNKQETIIDIQWRKIGIMQIKNKNGKIIIIIILTRFILFKIWQKIITKNSEKENNSAIW